MAACAGINHEAQLLAGKAKKTKSTTDLVYLVAERLEDALLVGQASHFG